MASHPIVTSTSQDNVTDANPTEEAESVSGRAPEPASCFFPIPTALTPVHSALASTSMVEPDALPQVSLPGDHLPQVPQKPILWVYNAADGSVMTDKHGRPVSVGKLLATKPLRHEILTRPGPGGKKLYYMSGEGITRTLNDIFGFDGWDLNISRVQREEVIKEDKTGKFTVCYTAQVRLTHKLSGAYREDCGAGDAQDRSFGTAVANAMKASITDALKRAARHFGDKCGNSLYQGKFSINKAPNSLQEAIDMYDIERANTKFGFNTIPPTVTKSNSSPPKSIATVSSTIPITVPVIPAPSGDSSKPFHQTSRPQQQQSELENVRNINSCPQQVQSHASEHSSIAEKSTDAPQTRPTSSYGRHKASNYFSNKAINASSKPVFPAPPNDNEDNENTRRVSLEVPNVAQLGITRPSPYSQHPSVQSSTLSKNPIISQSSSAHPPAKIPTVTKTTRPPLHSLPPQHTIQDNSCIIPATANIDVRQDHAKLASKPKRSASMMSNPYSQQHSYPNKGGRI